jgi:peroxiredoxin
MPALQRAYEANKNEGLVVLGINETYIDDLDAARSFVDDLGLTFPNARDDGGDLSPQLYRIIGLPTSVLITPDGDVAHVQIETFSRQLIAGEPISP